MTTYHFNRPFKEFLLKNVVGFVTLKLVTGKQYLMKEEELLCGMIY